MPTGEGRGWRAEVNMYRTGYGDRERRRDGEWERAHWVWVLAGMTRTMTVLTAEEEAGWGLVTGGGCDTDVMSEGDGSVLRQGGAEHEQPGGTVGHMLPFDGMCDQRSLRCGGREGCVPGTKVHH